MTAETLTALVRRAVAAPTPRPPSSSTCPAAPRSPTPTPTARSPAWPTPSPPSACAPGDRVAVQAEKSPAARAALPGLRARRRRAAADEHRPTPTTRSPTSWPTPSRSLLVQDPGRARRPDVAEVATLDAAGARHAGRRSPPTSPTHHDAVATGARRPRRHPLHERHDGPAQGRHAHAAQPGVQRASRSTGSGGSGPTTSLLHALPVFHTHGLFVATNCALANGTGMIFLPRFDPAAVLEQLPRATVFMGVPTYYTRLLAEPGLDAERCRHVRLFVSGSAPLLAATHDEFRRRTGHRILERYGMTETSMITSNPLDGERRPGTVGFPLPDVEVRVTRPRPAPRWPPARSAASRCGAPTCSPGTGASPSAPPPSAPPTASSAPATSAWSTPTATCTSSAGRRTSSSRAGSTSTRRRSRRCSTSSTASSRAP